MSPMGNDLLDRIQDLNDVELTILSCLVAGEHAIFTSNSDTNIDEKLASTLRQTFSINCALLSCTGDTTVDTFNQSVLLPSGSAYDGLALQDDGDALDERQITEAVILSDLDLASETVQVQVIDLLRTRRIYTQSAMHTAPKNFLLIITLTSPNAKLTYHLNDMIAVSHNFDAEDEQSSTGTALARSEIDLLRTQLLQVRLTAEIDAYLYNIVLFMRMSRFVQGGISATATRQMRVICKALAALHGISFVTPSIVMLAARKIYPHRIVMATATTEKSLQWGSDPAAVQKLLSSTSIPEIIENVIASVETPL